jgi:hypothetical protein
MSRFIIQVSPNVVMKRLQENEMVVSCTPLKRNEECEIRISSKA